MGINRIKLQKGSPAEMAKAQAAATSDPALDAIRKQLFGEQYVQDIGSGKGIAQYYSGFGLPQSLQFTQPTVDTPAVDTATPVVDSGGGGGGGGATLPGFDDPAPERINTPEQQRLIDAGIGVQLEPGSPVSSPYEGMPPTQDEMDAFNQIPVNREYGEPMNIGYGEGQVDPSLAAAVGGVDTTPIDLTGNIQVEDFSKPFDDFLGRTGKRVSYPGDQSGTISGVTKIEDLPEVRTITDGQDNVYDAATGKLLGNKYEYQGQFEPDEGTIFDDSPELGYQISEKAKSAFEKVKSGALSTADYIKEFGQKVFDGLSAGLSNLKPIGLSLLEQIQPASGMQQELVADQFAEEGVQFDDIGRIKQVGLDYDTPENVMAGYNPGATGLQIGDTKIGGGIIQESVVDRLATLEKTKNEKYGGSFYNADGTPKNNPDTGQPTKLGQREEALKENLNTVARAAGAVTLDGPQYTTNPDAEGYAPFSDTLKAGTTTYATDYFPELGQEESAPNIITPLAKPDVAEDVIKPINTISGVTGAVNTITGKVYPDEVLAREDLETSTLPDQPPGGGDASMFYETPTPDNIIANTGDAFDYFNDVDISQDAPTTVDDFDNFDDFEVSGDAAPITGDSASDSFFDAVDNAAAEAAAAQPISNAQAAANQESNRGGGGGDPAPSAPAPAAPVYQDAIMRGQSGGGSDSSGGGGKIVCTMMNESYGFGSFRNKIWMKFHKNLSPEYQKGYHKLFLPLVKIAKTNKVVKKVLEHIAVHSTIDMRQATRGKTHLLGRVYRKIILPLCYWAGKHVK